MSFTNKVKTELCTKPVERDCCKVSLVYGLLLCANIFDGNRIRFVVENQSVAELAAKLANDCFGATLEVEKSVEGRAPQYKIATTQRANLDPILEGLGYTRYTLSFRLNRSVFLCPECSVNFLKGVFLSCGTMTDPKRQYHLEFAFSHLNLSRDVAALLEDAFAPPKAIVRRNSYILYYKDSERNEDFLSLIGEQKYAFEIMDTKILKDIRNNANRLANCDTANIEKTIAASGEQSQVIEKLIKAGKLAELGPEIVRTAELRLEYPDASLKEIGEMLSPPTTKSCINHRIRKIMRHAQEVL